MDSSIQSQPHGLQPDLSKPSSISFNPSLHQINSASSMVLDTDTETVELKAWLARNPTRPFPILRLPTTIILHIFARLDLPDLDSLRSAGNPMLSVLAADSVLHQQRLRAVGTTCLEPYFLKRPTRLELAKSWKLKGLNMEAKIIRGSYLHSPSSIKHFENSQRFTRSMICHKLTKALSARPVLWQLTTSNLIDEELQTVSAALAPTIRLLKRELAKDRLAQQMRYGPGICNSSYQHLLKHHSWAFKYVTRTSNLLFSFIPYEMDSVPIIAWETSNSAIGLCGEMINLGLSFVVFHSQHSPNPLFSLLTFAMLYISFDKFTIWLL